MVQLGPTANLDARQNQSLSPKGTQLVLFAGAAAVLEAKVLVVLGLMDGWMDGRTDGRTDGWMDGWTNRWMDGWMDSKGREREREKEREREIERERESPFRKRKSHGHSCRTSVAARTLDACTPNPLKRGADQTLDQTAQCTPLKAFKRERQTRTSTPGFWGRFYTAPCREVGC